MADMVVLGLDCACSACSVALLVEGKVAASESVAMPRGHAEALVPMIESTLAAASISYQEIDRIGVTVGPGSFTGMRTGLATARALSLALGKPLAGVTTLEVVAAMAAATLAEDAVNSESPAILAVMETRRTDLYVQLFGGPDSVLDAPTAAAAEDILSRLSGVKDSITVAGDGAPRLLDSPAASPVRFQHLAGILSPDAAMIARLAAKTNDRLISDRNNIRPLYIHPPQATIPKNGGKLRP